jgi:delta 1-pyrroline-5-carboxylate dehydrogenase
VHQITDKTVPAASLVTDVYEQARSYLEDPQQPSSALPTGAELFAERRNSRGIDLQHAPTLIALAGSVERADAVHAVPLIGV